MDWYDERGVVRSSDHYNRYGAIYGRTVFNAKGQKVNKTYFSADGREIIVENFVTGDIILNEGNEIFIFHNKTELVLHFFVRANLKQSRIFFNSLSTPFFVSNRLKAQVKRQRLCKIFTMFDIVRIRTDGGSEDDEEDAATTEEGSYGRAGGQLPEIAVRISKIKALHRNQRLI